MAKLPKVKKGTQEDASVEDQNVVVEEPTEEVEDQNEALTSIMSAAEHGAESAGNEDADEEEETASEDEAPDVGATTEETADEEATEEESEEPVDAGENPETAPPSTENAKDDVVIIAPPKAATPKPTTVKVATVCDHTCHIGGVPYHFKRGVITHVPEPVKEILRNAGLLTAL